MLRFSFQSVATLKRIPGCLSMLEKYGRHLLKPPESRVSGWRQVRFSNSIFQERVVPVQVIADVNNFFLQSILMRVDPDCWNLYSGNLIQASF